MTLQGQANPERPNLNAIYVCNRCDHLHHTPNDRVHQYRCLHDGTALWWDPACWGCDYHTSRDPKSKIKLGHKSEEINHKDTKHSRSN